MSLISGVRGFSVSMYGQSGIVMDWFGLADPFTQQVPLKITNAYSGTLWFQGTLINPRSGYFNYSGIRMGAVNSGASTTLLMTFDAGVSGWIATSSPITDTLTLNLTTFTSSNYTGSYSSGNFTVFNTLFNRYSGVIKLFGDIYNNDQPTPNLSTAGGGSLVSGATYSYAISYILSGWESDVGSPASQTLNVASGNLTIPVSWTAITGATRYFVWRWSGSTDFTAPGPSAQSGTVDLLVVTANNSYTDNGAAPTQTGFYRLRNWTPTQGTMATDASVFLSPPQSRLTPSASNPILVTHSYHVSKNASGNSLLGPIYAVFHWRPSLAGSNGRYAIGLLTNQNLGISGTTIADAGALNNQLSGAWYRQAIMMGSSGAFSSSGTASIQFEVLVGSTQLNVDDVFICAVS